MTDMKKAPRCEAGRSMCLVDGLKYLGRFGMTRRIGVEASVSFCEAVGLIFEGEMGEGEQRGDDAGGFGRDVAFVAIRLAGYSKTGF